MLGISYWRSRNIKLPMKLNHIQKDFLNVLFKNFIKVQANVWLTFGFQKATHIHGYILTAIKFREKNKKIPNLLEVFCTNLHWKFLLSSGWVKMYIGNWVTSKFEVKTDSVPRFSSKMWSWTYISVYNEETGELQMFCFSFLEVCRQGNSFPSISSLASSVGKQNLQGKHFASSRTGKWIIIYKEKVAKQFTFSKDSFVLHW